MTRRERIDVAIMLLGGEGAPRWEQGFAEDLTAERADLYSVLDAARESVAECNAARDEGGYSSSDCSGCEAFNLCAALDAYDAEGGENG